MADQVQSRYALGGTTGAGAVSLTESTFDGEVEATWFVASVDRKEMKHFMRRSDAAGFAHFGVWLLLLIGTLTGVIVTWWSWATVPFLAAYGLLYAMSDHHAHELSHGTPFKSRWINEALYQVNAFMTLHEPVYWRWSHTRHHTSTLLVGRDPEIAVKRPPSLWRIAADFLFLAGGWGQIRNLFAIAVSAKITGDGDHFIPAPDRARVVRNSRVYCVIFVAVIALGVGFRSLLPVVVLVTPRFWGGPFAQFFNVTQHAGLPEDVHDHRLNCRTVRMNPLFRFMYANMNFHVEHHMFPMVPFHALPKLHEAMKDQCPAPSPNTLAAWREFVPALRTQRHDPSYAIFRALPGTAAH